MVPSFILQPIVENAFKHGISPKEEGGVVRIRINPLRDKGLLYISVCDNGVGIRPEQLAQLKAALAQPGSAGSISASITWPHGCGFWINGGGWSSALTRAGVRPSGYTCPL